jgi:hypothetical protein
LEYPLFDLASNPIDPPQEWERGLSVRCVLELMAALKLGGEFQAPALLERLNPGRD